MRKRFRAVARLMAVVAMVGNVYLGSPSAQGAITTGGIAFVGYNAEGNDNLAFVALEDIAIGEVIYFNDNEWNGSAIGSGGAFNTGESEYTWTSTSLVTAGTIVKLDNISDFGSFASNFGSVAYTDTFNPGVSASDEAIYAFQRTMSGDITHFLTLIANDIESVSGSIANTGLAAGTTAIYLAPFDTDADIAEYVGPRNNQSSFSGYLSQIGTVNAASWKTQDGSGDQYNDGIAPDVPFNGTAFTLSVGGGDGTNLTATPATVDFGRVMLSSNPAAQNVTVSEDPSGTVGANYTTNNTSPKISIQSGASGAIANGGNAAISLDVDTSTTGSMAGSLLVNNTGNLGDVDNQTVTLLGAVVSQRVVTGSTVPLGRMMVGQTVRGAGGLTTTGSTNDRTSIQVATTAPANGDGVSISFGSDSDGNGPSTYDDATDVGFRQVSATFATPGAKAGSVGLPVTGEGLVGEGAYADVQVGYTASALENRDVPNTSVNLGAVIRGRSITGSTTIADSAQADAAATRTILNTGSTANDGLSVSVPSSHTFNGVNGGKLVNYEVATGFGTVGNGQSKAVNLAGQLSSGETAPQSLTAGDIAVVGFIDNDPVADQFAFVPLQNLGAGQVIYFTTNGSNGFDYRGHAIDAGAGNEDLIKFTAVNPISAGTIIRSTDTSANFAWTNSGLVPGAIGGEFGNLAIGSGGDQISAFTAFDDFDLPMAIPNHLYMVDDTDGFEGSATDSATSAVPNGLVGGQTAVTFNLSAANLASVNPALLTGSNTKAGWISTFANGVNWTSTTGEMPGSLPSGTIAVSDATSANALLPGQTLDDTLNVTLNANVFDPSTARFLSNGADTLTLNFGSFAQGSGTQSLAAAIENALQTAGFTAELDFDSISGAGNTGILFTDLANGEFASLSAGGANAYDFLAMFNTKNLPNTYSATYTLGLSDANGYLGAGAAGSQLLTLILNGTITGVPGVAAQWKSNVGGLWTSNGNWDPSAPVTASSTAKFGTFGGTVTTPQAVQLEAPTTVASVEFDNANKYTVSGSHTLTLVDGAAPLVVTSGSHEISAPVVLQNSGNVSVVAGGLLTLSEIGASGVSLNKSGAGAMVVGGAVQYTGSTTVSAGELQIQQFNAATQATSNATVATNAALVANSIRVNTLSVNGTATVRANGGTAGASKVETLSIGVGGKLNLKNNDLVVGTGTVADIRGQIKTGLLGAAGITSDVMTPAVHGFGYAAGSDVNLSPLLGNTLSGQTFDANSVLVKFTYRGDADLDGDSDLDDLGFWANSFTGDLGSPVTPSTFWIQGDWDYDGDTDLDDLGFWSSTFTGDLGGGGLSVYAPNAPAAAIAALGQMGITAVPEPGAISLLALGFCAIGLRLGRRRRMNDSTM